jgi:hypothetical protein
VDGFAWFPRRSNGRLLSIHVGLRALIFDRISCAWIANRVLIDSFSAFSGEVAAKLMVLSHERIGVSRSFSADPVSHGLSAQGVPNVDNSFTI